MKALRRITRFTTTNPFQLSASTISVSKAMDTVLEEMDLRVLSFTTLPRHLKNSINQSSITSLARLARKTSISAASAMKASVKIQCPLLEDLTSTCLLALKTSARAPSVTSFTKLDQSNTDDVH